MEVQVRQDDQEVMVRQKAVMAVEVAVVEVVVEVVEVEAAVARPFVQSYEKADK